MLQYLGLDSNDVKLIVSGISFFIVNLLLAFLAVRNARKQKDNGEGVAGNVAQALRDIGAAILRMEDADSRLVAEIKSAHATLQVLQHSLTELNVDIQILKDRIGRGA